MGDKEDYNILGGDTDACDLYAENGQEKWEWHKLGSFSCLYFLSLS